MVSELVQQYDPARDIPDLSGKIIVITGATSGLGKASCVALAKHNPAHIYILCRNSSKATIVIQEIQNEAPEAKITFIECDLGSLSSVKKAAETFVSLSPRLDVLMCNAGITWQLPGLTTDGYQQEFGVNHLGHALLIKCLLPTLLKTAEIPDSDVRIVILASDTHANPPEGGIRFEELRTTQSDIVFFKLYGQSKLANVIYARSLAQKYPSIRTISVHPGATETEMTGPNNAITNSSTFWFVFWRTFTAIRKTRRYFTGEGWFKVEDGVKTQLWAATVEKDKIETGAYYVPVGVTGQDSELSKDEKLRDELWEWTENQLKDF